MPAYQGLGSRIQPGIELRTITITLDRYKPPQVMASGRTQTGNRDVDMYSRGEVHTALIGPKAAAFIREIKTQFPLFVEDEERTTVPGD